MSMALHELGACRLHIVMEDVDLLLGSENLRLLCKRLALSPMYISLANCFDFLAGSCSVDTSLPNFTRAFLNATINRPIESRDGHCCKLLRVCGLVFGKEKG